MPGILPLLSFIVDPQISLDTIRVVNFQHAVVSSTMVESIRTVNPIRIVDSMRIIAFMSAANSQIAMTLVRTISF